jgi:hypothetical protein
VLVSGIGQAGLEVLQPVGIDELGEVLPEALVEQSGQVVGR